MLLRSQPGQLHYGRGTAHAEFVERRERGSKVSRISLQRFANRRLAEHRARTNSPQKKQISVDQIQRFLKCGDLLTRRRTASVASAWRTSRPSCVGSGCRSWPYLDAAVKTKS